MVFSRCILVTVAAILIGATETRADDAIGWTLVGKRFVDSARLSLAILNLNGDSGLQVAVVSGSIKLGSAQRFSLGLGYDDMVASYQYGGVRQGLPITEQLFLLQTSCDKRFQLTLQFRW
jgi:hypothetical protein